MMGVMGWKPVEYSTPGVSLFFPFLFGDLMKYLEGKIVKRKILSSNRWEPAVHAHRAARRLRPVASAVGFPPQAPNPPDRLPIPPIPAPDRPARAEAFHPYATGPFQPAGCPPAGTTRVAGFQ